MTISDNLTIGKLYRPLPGTWTGHKFLWQTIKKQIEEGIKGIDIKAQGTSAQGETVFMYLGKSRDFLSAEALADPDEQDSFEILIFLDRSGVEICFQSGVAANSFTQVNK